MNETTKKCPLCAEEIKAEAKICRFCGARFEIKMQGYCASCHAKRDTDEAGNCRVCGNPLMDVHVESKLAGSAGGRERENAGLQVAGTGSQPIVTDPNQRQPKKSGAGRVLLTCLVVLLIVAGGIFVAFYFTGGAQLMKPVETVTFDTISQYEKERHVTIEGFLNLPFSTNCDDNCGLQLVDYKDPDKELTVFVDVGGQNGIPEPNHMLRLPSRYETDSLKVGLSGGGVAGDDASVILTGRICETTTGKICLHVEQIAQGSIPPTPIPTKTPLPTSTPRPTSTPLPVNVDFSNVCTHNGAPVIIRGKIGHLPMFMFCSQTCSLTFVDPGGSGKYIYFTITRGGLANQMENLPDKYRDSDLKIHTNDGQVVGVGGLVILHGTVVVYNSTSEKDLGCKILLNKIEAVP